MIFECCRHTAAIHGAPSDPWISCFKIWRLNSIEWTNHRQERWRVRASPQHTARLNTWVSLTYCTHFYNGKFIVVINLMFLHMLYHSNRPVGLKIIRPDLSWMEQLTACGFCICSTHCMFFLFWPHELNLHDLDRKIIHNMLYMVPRVTGNGNVFSWDLSLLFASEMTGRKTTIASYHLDNEKPTGSSTS